MLKPVQVDDLVIKFKTTKLTEEIKEIYAFWLVKNLLGMWLPNTDKVYKKFKKGVLA